MQFNLRKMEVFCERIGFFISINEVGCVLRGVWTCTCSIVQFFFNLGMEQFYAKLKM